MSDENDEHYDWHTQGDRRHQSGYQAGRRRTDNPWLWLEHLCEFNETDGVQKFWKVVLLVCGAGLVLLILIAVFD